jgi:hypothetical protein
MPSSRRFTHTIAVPFRAPATVRALVVMLAHSGGLAAVSPGSQRISKLRRIAVLVRVE